MFCRILFCCGDFIENVWKFVIFVISDIRYLETSVHFTFVLTLYLGMVYDIFFSIFLPKMLRREKFSKKKSNLPRFFWSHVASKILYVWWDSSSSESFRLPEWWEENTASRQGSFRERSPKGSRLAESLFLDVPGTAAEQVRTCGFRRNSSSLDKAPKIRDSVRLNSFESLLVTLPSVSSETWEIYSWAISGSIVFRDRVFFVFSGISLETTANFLLSLKVAMIMRDKFSQL